MKRAVADPSIIDISDIADDYPDVRVLDRDNVARLARVFLGLTHTESNIRECRRFAIASAIRVLGEMRGLVNARNL